MQPEITTQKKIKSRARRTVTAVFFTGILMLTLNLMISLYAGRILRSLFGEAFLQVEWQWLAADMLLYVVLMLPPIFLLALFLRKNPFRALGGPLDTTRLPILYIFMTIGLLYLLNILVQLLLGDVLEPFNRASEPFLPLTPVGIILYVVEIAVLPAFFEEWLFRGMMLRHLKTAVGAVGAVCISAFVFGLMHLNPAQSIFAFGFGLFAGYAYLRTGSIWFGVLLHFTNNLISCALQYQRALFPSEKNDLLLVSYILIMIGCAIIFAIIFGFVSHQKRKVRRKTTEEQRLPLSRTVIKQVFLNPTPYLLLACYAGLLWLYNFYAA